MEKLGLLIFLFIYTDSFLHATRHYSSLISCDPLPTPSLTLAVDLLLVSDLYYYMLTLTGQ